MTLKFTQGYPKSDCSTADVLFPVNYLQWQWLHSASFPSHWHCWHYPHSSLCGAGSSNGMVFAPRTPLLWVCCCGPGEQARSIACYPVLSSSCAAPRRAATNAGSATMSANVGSWTRNTDLFTVNNCQSLWTALGMSYDSYNACLILYSSVSKY